LRPPFLMGLEGFEPSVDTALKAAVFTNSTTGPLVPKGRVELPWPQGAGRV
jgi:hypothetical protein